MSQENVEIVRGAFRSWYPNDSQAFARCLDPGFEYHVTYGPGRGVHRGWKATVQAVDHWQEAFSDYRGEATSFIDAGEEHVIVPFVEHGLGQSSRIRIEQRPVLLCTVKSGRILRLAEYQTQAEALKAVVWTSRRPRPAGLCGAPVLRAVVVLLAADELFARAPFGES